ncbi:TPA: hypothetical protein ACGO0M_002065 [Streptococcus suis]
MSLKEMNNTEKVMFGVEVGVALLGVHKNLLQPLKIDTVLVSNANNQACLEIKDGKSMEQIDNLLGQLSDVTDKNNSEIYRSSPYKKKDYSEKRYK